MQNSRKYSHQLDLFGIFLCALILVGGAFWLTLQSVQPAPPSKIVVAAASEGSPYFSLAKRYRAALAANGVSLEIKETTGSPENLKLLRDDTAGVQAGFLQGGIATPDESRRLRSLGRVLYEPVWIFCNTAVMIDRISNLKGRRVLVGPAGSGTNRLAMRILAANGVNAKTATLAEAELPDYVEALNSGRADAGFLVLGADARTVQKLFASPNVRLMGLPQSDAYAQRFPYLTPLDLKQGIIDFASNVPAGNTPMVATTTSFIVRDDIHPALANLLTQVLVIAHLEPAVDINGEVGVFDSNGVFPIQSDPEFKMADEALRVYRSGAPFLQRFMPFWLATLIDRMVLMAIPVIGILLPALRFAPLLYTWRVRRRLLYWYKQLKSLEDDVTLPSRAEQNSAQAGADRRDRSRSRSHEAAARFCQSAL